jgi:hypothetical protein
VNAAGLVIMVDACHSSAHAGNATRLPEAAIKAFMVSRLFISDFFQRSGV